MANSWKTPCEEHSRRGVEELTPVVFPDAKHLEPHLVSSVIASSNSLRCFAGSTASVLILFSPL